MSTAPNNNELFKVAIATFKETDSTYMLAVGLDKSGFVTMSVNQLYPPETITRMLRQCANSIVQQQKLLQKQRQQKRHKLKKVWAKN